MTPTEHHARWFGRAARILEAHGFKIQVARGHYIGLYLIGPRGDICGHSFGADMCEAVEKLLLEIFKPDMRYNSKLAPEEFERLEQQRMAGEQARSFEDFAKYRSRHRGNPFYDSFFNP